MTDLPSTSRASNNANPQSNSTASNSSTLTARNSSQQPVQDGSKTYRQKEIELTLIDCRLPDYVVTAMKRHLPALEVVEAVINYANDFNFLEAELHDVIIKTKAERDDLHAALMTKSMVPRAQYNQLKDEKDASDLRAREYAEDLASRNDDVERYQREIRELDGFVQQHLDSIDRLGEEKKKLLAEISALKSLPKPPPAPVQPQTSSKSHSDLQVKFIKQSSDLVAERAKSSEALKKLQEIEEIRAKLSAELDIKSRRCDELEMSIVEKDGIIDSRNNAIWRHEINVANLDRQIADQNSKIADLRAEVARFKANNSKLEDVLKATSDQQAKRVEELERQLAEKSNEMENFKSIDSAKIEQFDRDLSAKSKEIDQIKANFTQQIEEKTSQFDKLKLESTKRVGELEREISELKLASSSKAAQENAELTSLRQQIFKFNSQLDKFKGEINTLKLEVEAEKNNASLFSNKYESEKTSYALFAQQSKEVNEFRKKRIDFLEKKLKNANLEIQRLRNNRSSAGTIDLTSVMTSPNDQGLSGGEDQTAFVLEDPAVEMSPPLNPSNTAPNKKRKFSLESEQCEVPSESPLSTGDPGTGATRVQPQEPPAVFVDQKEVLDLKEAMETLAREVTLQKETIKQLEASVIDARSEAGKQFNADRSRLEATLKKCELLNEKLGNLERHISQHLIVLETKKAAFNVNMERKFFENLIHEIRLESVEDGECINLVDAPSPPPPSQQSPPPLYPPPFLIEKRPQSNLSHFSPPNNRFNNRQFGGFRRHNSGSNFRGKYFRP